MRTHSTGEYARNPAPRFHDLGQGYDVQSLDHSFDSENYVDKKEYKKHLLDCHLIRACDGEKKF